MKCDKALVNRLKRTQGQMQGIIKLMESDTACIDILAQLKAVRSGIDKAIGLLTTQNLIQTIEDDFNIKLDNIHDAVDLIIKGK
ncbi:MAG: metal-sensing transcriptional repressor [Candidatus Izemoplasmataceae bacterium]|jgi:CsoR family transcriptional regulator, copper-sensing transcriptional repressor|uniref:metal-sensing transcriptional repressor n=1 Tax=Liberiplasma polymorphum TaxID=3374570 RepID=UPI0037738148